MSVEQKLNTITENIPKVYEAGKTEGIAQGRKSQENEFWDIFQNYGKRKNYPYTFYGEGWTDATYKPRYDIATWGNYYALYKGALITDTIITIDCTNLATSDQMFYGCTALKTIRKLLSSKTSVYANNAFQNCTALENITFEGEIGTNVNLQYSPLLTRASIENIMNCLSLDVSGQTVTFSQTAVNNAFTTEEWGALANTKPNWTKSLI